MLKIFSKARGLRKRAPRDAIKCTATMRVEHGFVRARLRDVSANGCKLEVDGPVSAGRFVQVALESYHSLGAQIRWYRDGVAGVQFIRPLSDAALANWKKAVVNSPADADTLNRRDGLRRDFWGQVRHRGD